MNYEQDVQHFATILAGCENLNSGAELNYDGKYAQSVLRLHAQDAGFVDGTEGFTDAVKKGATKIMEWIKKLVDSIRGFFKSDAANRIGKAIASIKKGGSGSSAPKSDDKKEEKKEEKKDDAKKDDKREDKKEEKKEEPKKEEKKGHHPNSKPAMFISAWKHFGTHISQAANRVSAANKDEVTKVPGVSSVDALIARCKKAEEMVNNNQGDLTPIDTVHDLSHALKNESEKITNILNNLTPEAAAKAGPGVAAAGKLAAACMEGFKIITSGFDAFAARSQEWHAKYA